MELKINLLLDLLPATHLLMLLFDNGIHGGNDIPKVFHRGYYLCVSSWHSSAMKRMSTVSNVH